MIFALQPFITFPGGKSLQEIQEITFEIGSLGKYGLDPRNRARSSSAVCLGRQVLHPGTHEALRRARSGACGNATDL